MKHLFTLLFLLVSANFLLAQASDKTATSLAEAKPIILFSLDASATEHPDFEALSQDEDIIISVSDDKVQVGFSNKATLDNIPPDAIGAIMIFKDDNVPPAFADYGQEGVIQIQLKSDEAFWAMLKKE